MELVALAIVVGYTVLAVSTQSGAHVAGQGLDPVWAAAQQRGVLLVAVDFGYAPFTGIRNGEPSGYDIDLARAVAQKLGLRAAFVPSNLDSIYDDLATGQADLAASALPYAPEQGWRARFSTFYFNAGQVLIVPGGSSITGEGDLAGRAVGVALGSDADTYARRLARAEPRIRLHSAYETAEAALDELRRGGLDAVIADNTTASIALSRAPGLRLAAALTLEPYVLAMPAPAFQLHTRVNAALDELRREGFFDELGRKWFGETGDG